MKKVLLSCCTGLFAVASFAQTAPAIQWQKCYGGTVSDIVRQINTTPDGGFILTGSSSSPDGDVGGNNSAGFNWTDVWVIKMNASGTITWKNYYGGSYHEEGYDICPTHDGGYIIAGMAQSKDHDVTVNHGQEDAWIIKTDSKGKIAWQKSYGGSGRDYAYKIAEDGTEGYMFVGQTSSTDGDVTGNHGQSDLWVVRLDDTGKIEWQQCLGGTKADYGRCVKTTKDGNYIIAGFSASKDGNLTANNGLTDQWVLKVNQGGGIIWQKSFGGWSVDEAESIYETKSGDFIVCGLTTDTTLTGYHRTYPNQFLTVYGPDAVVTRLDAGGNIKWQRAYGGSTCGSTIPKGGAETAYDIIEATDGSYVMVSTTGSADGDVTGFHNVGDSTRSDLWVSGIDTSGQLLWQKAYGGTHDDGPYAHILQTPDKGFMIATCTYSDDGDVHSGGYHNTTGNNNGSPDYWVLKLGPAPPQTGIEHVNTDPAKVYPTVTDDVLNIAFPEAAKPTTIRLLNVLGQEQKTAHVPAGTRHTILQLQDMPAGMYILQLANANGNSSYRIYKK